MAYYKLKDKCMSDLLKTFFITLNINFLSLIYQTIVKHLFWAKSVDLLNNFGAN